MFEQPPLFIFSNIELEEFIQFSQFDGLYFLFGLFIAFLIIYSALNLIFESSFHTMIKRWIFAKSNTSKTEDKIWAIFLFFCCIDDFNHY